MFAFCFFLWFQTATMTSNIYKAGQVPSISSSQHGGKEDEQTTEKVIKTFRGILNKLTPEKFESLMSQVDELNIKDEETLNTIVKLVVDKVLTEQSYSTTYAQMCYHLKGVNSAYFVRLVKFRPDYCYSYAKPFPHQLTVSSKSSDGFVYFHKCLLRRFQVEFENRGPLKEKDDKVSAAQEVSTGTPTAERNMQAQLLD